MSLDRKLTIQELLFSTPLEKINAADFAAGGVTASQTASMDLDAPQFHVDRNFFEKVVEHIGKNWGWYAGAAAIGLVVYYSTKPEKSKPKLNGYFMHMGFIPFPDVPVMPIKININPDVSIRSYLDKSKSLQIKTD
jgi:hypothetical protein